ncbi:hypothetical protein [Cupriavidus sp. D39]|uniref:hypothetical protein n=1 Tax=Cupriavidus sp. D39 TaxID=2997877 RepID=UPI00226EA076|nr:hypothetical protein [Cupriavidus sp. D39]MCY0854961.1 hypothetical protein [Cupriavidus sp. D39]
MLPLLDHSNSLLEIGHVAGLRKVLIDLADAQRIACAREPTGQPRKEALQRLRPASGEMRIRDEYGPEGFLRRAAANRGVLAR